MTDAPARRGRPRDLDAPGRILAAARTLFHDRGFTDTSIRGVAEAAGSSPVVVLRHFGSKEQLFLQAMTVDRGLGSVVEGPLEDLARLMLERLLDGPDAELAPIWRALMLAGDQREIQRYRREAAQQFLFQALAERLEGPNAELRAHLVASQIIGLILVLWVDEDPVLGALPTARLVAEYAPSLQRLIDTPIESGR